MMNITNPPNRLVAFSIFCSLITLVSSLAVAQPPGSRGRPTYQQPLVKKFDADKNGRVDGAERTAALEWIRAEREKNPPRRRGSGGGETSEIEPQRVGKRDVKSFANHKLYDVDVIRTIFLDFEQPEWSKEMALFWRTEISTPATLTMDGVKHPNVGVRFRGTSSFFTILNRKKKSFAISMDWADNKQRLAGYKSLNLLNGHADPTFLRTVLFGHIAGKYIAMPKASFVHLVVNGESYGLYINDQQMNKDFTKEAFGTRGGARWKVAPNFAGQAALAYQGPNVEDYDKKYSLRSAKSKSKAWSGLIELCNILSNSTPEELEQKLPARLDIDHALWFLALDNILMDGDGYHYRGSDYALYMRPDGRFYPMFRDNNESFSYGGGPGGFGREGGRSRRSRSLKLDPLVRADEERAALSHALLSVPKWKAQYLDNCRTIARDWLDWKKTGPLVEKWRKQIEPMIKQDDKALYGHEAFVKGLDAGTDRKPGLKKFCEERRAFLDQCDALKKVKTEESEAKETAAETAQETAKATVDGPVNASVATDKPYPGYTLFSVGRTAYLYDMNKKKVHQWEVAKGSIQTTPYLLADGSVLFPLNQGGFTFRPGGAHPSGTFQKVSWDGEVLWDFSFYGDKFTPSYDVEPMPNGNILVCAGFEDRRMPGKLFEIKPKGKDGGEVVWECNVTEKLGGRVRGYINSVSYDSKNDQVLVNIQTPGTTLAVFDHSKTSADLVYQWNQGFSGRLHGGFWVTGQYIGTDIDIPDADKKSMRVGNIITVSNGDNEVVEIDPRTNKKVKTIKYEFSKHQGSVQRLPNGNTLIVSGYSNTINEVDRGGKVVWSLKVEGRVSRAYRYGLEFPGVSKLKKQ